MIDIYKEWSDAAHQNILKQISTDILSQQNIDKRSYNGNIEIISNNGLQEYIQYQNFRMKQKINECSSIKHSFIL